MTTKMTEDTKAPEAIELSDAEVKDVSGGFMNPEKGYGVKDTKTPKVEELTDADLDKASGGLVGDDVGLLVKGEKPKPGVESFGELDPWPRDGSKTSKT
jgi:hypothetical protein